MQSQGNGGEGAPINLDEESKGKRKGLPAVETEERAVLVRSGRIQDSKKGKRG